VVSDYRVDSPVSASAFFAGATLGLSPGQISIQLSALPGPQRFALGAIMLTTLSLIGYIGMAGLQPGSPKTNYCGIACEPSTGSSGAHDAQNQFDSSVQHPRQQRPRGSTDLDPEDLTDTEQRAAAQQTRYESIDLHDRLEEIRRRHRHFERWLVSCRKNGGLSSLYSAN